MTDPNIAELRALREALADMAWQFGYRTTISGAAALHTGGVSALERAFALLGWDDPYMAPDSSQCDINNCHDWSSSGLLWGDLYLWLCSEHAMLSQQAERPPIKARALRREAMRVGGVLPADWEEQLDE